ncbi:tyrosine-type recombinase/integrase [Nocardioides sp.]|uniref:tyrosine-type recombinase/integrase n=1 Tax=Nocardioides sp. TaxID=35761 RepID=UPI002B5D63B1|nr:tyrosine-type recombinase/integrase [Nocardioides sp.]HXH78182.1 tyrosine-type recombinase/integrase [Nocardioides sp.]
MASIQPLANGKRRARYRDAAGKEHARHFDTKREAQQWLDQVTASVVRGDYVDPQAGRTTVAVYAASWEAIQVSSEGTRRIVDNALRLHVLPVLGGHKIATVRRSHVQALVKELEGKGLSAGSVRNIYEVVARLFDAAAEDRVIASTPCRRIALPKGDGAEVVPPALEQIEAIRSHLDERWQVIPLVLAGSGLRIGELLGLGMFDVDYLRRSVRVERQRLQSGALAPLKSKTSRRTVPIGEVVVEALTAHLAAHPGTDEALFTDEWDDPLTYRRWKSLWRAAATTAGVDATSHDLRHFAASALISGGASVKQVQTFLGHSSAVITLRTYAHMFPGDEDRTRNVLDAALRPVLSPSADSVRTEAAPR